MTETNKENKQLLLYRTSNMRLVWLIVAKQRKMCRKLNARLLDVLLTRSFAMYSLVGVEVAAEACCYQPHLPDILHSCWEVACSCYSSHALQIAHHIHLNQNYQKGWVA